MLPQLKLKDIIGKTIRTACHFGFDKERLILVFDDGYVQFVAERDDCSNDGASIVTETLFMGGHDDARLVKLGIATADEVVASRNEQEAKRLALTEAKEWMEYERLAAKFAGVRPNENS